MDTLGVLVRPDSLPMGIATLLAAQVCFKGRVKANRLLIHHAQNFRRLKYDKALLRMFVKSRV